MNKKDNWFRRRLIVPFIQLAKQGLTPSQLALSITSGFLLAFFPVFGSHSLLCLLIIWLLKLNPAAVFLINNLAYPLVFILYLPQIRLGEWLFSAPPFPFSVKEVIHLVSNTPLIAIKTLWNSTLMAIVAWIAIASLLGPLLFILTRIITKPLFAALKS